MARHARHAQWWNLSLRVTPQQVLPQVRDVTDPGAALAREAKYDHLLAPLTKPLPQRCLALAPHPHKAKGSRLSKHIR